MSSDDDTRGDHFPPTKHDVSTRNKSNPDEFDSVYNVNLDDLETFGAAYDTPRPITSRFNRKQPKSKPFVTKRQIATGVTTATQVKCESSSEQSDTLSSRSNVKVTSASGHVTSKPLDVTLSDSDAEYLMIDCEVKDTNSKVEGVTSEVKDANCEVKDVTSDVKDANCNVNKDVTSEVKDARYDVKDATSEVKEVENDVDSELANYSHQSHPADDAGKCEAATDDTPASPPPQLDGTGDDKMDESGTTIESSSSRSLRHTRRSNAKTSLQTQSRVATTNAAVTSRRSSRLSNVDEDDSAINQNNDVAILEVKQPKRRGRPPKIKTEPKEKLESNTSPIVEVEEKSSSGQDTGSSQNSDVQGQIFHVINCPDLSTDVKFEASVLTSCRRSTRLSSAASGSVRPITAEITNENTADLKTDIENVEATITSGELITIDERNEILGNDETADLYLIPTLEVEAENEVENMAHFVCSVSDQTSAAVLTQDTDEPDELPQLNREEMPHTKDLQDKEENMEVLDDGVAEIPNDIPAPADGDCDDGDDALADCAAEASNDTPALGDNNDDDITSPRRHKSRRLTVSDEEDDGLDEYGHKKPAKPPPAALKTKQAMNWSIVKRDATNKKPAIKTKSMNMKTSLAEPELLPNKPPRKRHVTVARKPLPPAIRRRLSSLRAPTAVENRSTQEAPVDPAVKPEVKLPAKRKSISDISSAVTQSKRKPEVAKQSRAMKSEVIATSRDVYLHEGVDPVAKAKRMSRAARAAGSDVTSHPILQTSPGNVTPSSPKPRFMTSSVAEQRGSDDTPNSPARDIFQRRPLDAPLKIIPLEKDETIGDSAEESQSSASINVVGDNDFTNIKSIPTPAGFGVGKPGVVEKVQIKTPQLEAKQAATTTTRSSSKGQGQTGMYDVLGDILSSSGSVVVDTTKKITPVSPGRNEQSVNNLTSNAAVDMNIMEEVLREKNISAHAQQTTSADVADVRQSNINLHQKQSDFNKSNNKTNTSRDYDKQAQLASCKSNSGAVDDSAAADVCNAQTTHAHIYSAPAHMRDPHEWQMYEKPTEFKQPISDNVTYNLWQMGQQRVLIRCGYHGYWRKQGLDNPSSFIHLQPKLEYQLFYGYEHMTLEEISKAWINLAIRNECKLERVHINGKSTVGSEIVKYAEQDLSCLLQSTCNVFNPNASINVFSGLFTKLATLPVGQYLLSHAPLNTHAHIKKTTRSRTGVYDLKLAYKDVTVDETSVPWVPVDPSFPLPVHEHFNRIPCTFEPKDSGYVIKHYKGGSGSGGGGGKKNKHKASAQNPNSKKKKKKSKGKKSL